MNAETYTAKDFQQDMAALGKHFSASGEVSNLAILENTRRKYADFEDADERAHILIQAFAFSAQHKQALEDARAVVQGDKSNIAHWRVGEALYRWLVVMPWRGPAPAPKLETILQMIREPWSEKPKDGGTQ